MSIALSRSWRTAAAAGLAVAALGVANASSAPAHPAPPNVPVPRAHCGPGSHPETSTQGRVPAADFASGRAYKGYTCNTRLVGHFGKTAGFKVFRYVDTAGHVCGFYDTTRLFPSDVPTNATEGFGIYVLDMRNPAHPKHTATLSTPAMLSPHESLLLNQKRGLLVADMGYPTFNPGFVDVYDVKHDCLHPTLDSSTPMGVLGHESGFAPDGKTFYVTSTGGQVVSAVDLTNPKRPRLLATTVGHDWHGARVSDNGDYLYIADIGDSNAPGLDIYDVSSIQHRSAHPTFKLVSTLTWPNVSTPQVPIPMTIHGHHYLLEIDEFAYDPAHSVGAARIINIDDVHHPYVVSNIRLQVNQPKARTGPEQQDPGANFSLGGYAGHYCSVPREVNPGIVACSFLLSGERVFNVQNPKHPREVAYFNRPTNGTLASSFQGHSAAFSQAAWDIKRHEVWYSDGVSGLWVFKVTNGVWPRGLR
jgi:hypothetical protein